MTLLGFAIGCEVLAGVIMLADWAWSTTHSDGPGTQTWAEECQEFGCHDSDGDVS